ncbi:MAG: uroporphyrinogen decarboxylase family protein [Planctomycetota bacterium]
MSRNMNEWKESALRSRRPLAIPILTHPGIEKIGATVREALTSGECHFRAIRALVAMLPTAATTMIMDLSVEAEAFGAAVALHDHEVPTVTGRLVTSAEQIERLRVPDPLHARTREPLKALELTARHVKDRAVFAGCIGPLSLAGRLYGMTEIMMDLLEQPDLVHALLEKCTAFLTTYVKAFRERGADGIFMAEPAAGMLSPAACQEFSSDYIRTIVEAVQTETFAVMLHNCGNKGVLNACMASTGAWAYHLGNCNDIAKSLPEFPANALVLGNIDPAGTMKLGSAAQVREAVTGLLERTASYRNFILSTGCDTPPGVPWENVQAFFAALQEYNGRL